MHFVGILTLKDVKLQGSESYSENIYGNSFENSILTCSKKYSPIHLHLLSSSNSYRLLYAVLCL